MSGASPGSGEPDSEVVCPLPRDAARLTLLGHDLRAAVSDIIGGLRLIDHDGLAEGTRLQLERIRTSGEVLARLLEEGLAMMLGEEEFTATHPANVQIARLLHDMEMRWSGRAQEKGLAFGMRVAPEVPHVLALDRVALERALGNILSNAVKYTDAGRVDLDVAIGPSGALGFRVTDSGPGFSDEALVRLFEYEGRPADAGKPGQGLGLHISKDMAGRLGGQMTVRNRESGGAEVTLELPPDAWTPVRPGPDVQLPDLSRVKALVADDSPTNQSIIGHMLARMGAECVVASDGVEALQWLEREDFDIALIDIEMPRLSGIEVIRALRANERLHSNMPIVAVTAYVLRANREAIYAAGADAILAKPLAGIEVFGQAISGALERRRNAPPPPPVECDMVPDLNRETFDHLMDIAGPDGARELLDRLRNDLRRCEHGLVAGLAAADRTAIRSETHVLIALAGAVGAERLRVLAETLNASAHVRDQNARARIGEDCLAQISALIGLVEAERARRAEPA